MAEQQPGLRFDIYERVHLQEGLAGIEELNDVELIPDIRVQTVDDQAILKGNLLLSGSYSSNLGEQSRTLEHVIPVEITLPLNRIHRVEEILVEIENFDVDLLSPRSLNVTGVLSLQGVDVVSAPLETWRQEEVTFVHEANDVDVDMSYSEKQAVSAAPEFPYAPPAAAETEEVVEDDGYFSLDAQQNHLKVTTDPDQTTVTDEKQDLKVAFGKKGSEAAEINPHGIKSLLSKASSYFQDKRKEEYGDAALPEEAKTEGVEWKRLFLQSSSNQPEFRKLKMCIVQKAETLESIAERYQLNPRELQLLNRLGDQEITAGQVIYLP